MQANPDWVSVATQVPHEADFGMGISMQKAS